MAEFKKVAVLGAGVMGSGIAAHLAGAGIEVLCSTSFPPTAKGAATPSPPGGKEKALKAKPAAFFTARDADRIAVGNLEDDLAEAGKCDLVIEVVKEDLAIKQALFARLEPLLAEHTIVASNTSGLPIAQMMEGRSPSMRKRFLVTHFFNPVRYMKLLEIVAGKDTDPTVVERVARFGQDVLGKGIVHGKDTPNFVANRIGVFAMMHLIKLAIEQGYTVEEVDAIFGSPLGRPKTAVFRTADVVGLDTIVHVANNCYESLHERRAPRGLQGPRAPRADGREEDARRQDRRRLLKKTPEGIVTLDLKTLEYRPQQKAKFASIGATKGVADVGERIRKVLAGDDRAADLARRVTYATLAYSSNRIGEIADDVVNIDRGMRWGFGWDVGPFETWDAIGVQKGVDEMEEARHHAGRVGRARCSQSGRQSFYSDGTYWDVQARSRPSRSPTSPRELSLPRCARRAAWSSRTTAPRSTTSAIASPASSCTPR